jgi:hypothetical protein
MVDAAVPTRTLAFYHRNVRAYYGVIMSAGRVLYGYKRRPSGEIAVDPVAATVVSAVLMVAPIQRFGLASTLIRHLNPGLSASACMQLAHRIRRHSVWYRLGIARKGAMPAPHLVLAGQVHSNHTMHAPTPTAGQGIPAPTPRLPWRGVVVSRAYSGGP